MAALAALAAVAALAVPVTGTAAGAAAPEAPASTTSTTTSTTAAAPGAVPGASSARLELTAQDPWTAVGGDLTLRLAVAGAPVDASVSLSAFQAAASRKGFEAALAGGSAGSVLSQWSIPLAALDPPDPDGSRALHVGLASPTADRDPARLNVRRPGVYPLVVELRTADDQVVAGFRTALVVTEAPGRPTVADRLGVAWVWPLTGPPTHEPDGSPDRGVVASLRPDGRLGRQAAALRTVSDVAVTLVPGGDTLSAWAEFGHDDLGVQAGYDAVRASVPGRAVLNSTDVPVDLPSLLDHDLPGAVDEQMQSAATVLTSTYGSSLDPRTRLVRPASTSALTRLRASGADRFVVDASALAGAPEPRLTPAQPVASRVPTFSGSGSVALLSTLPSLQDLLVSDQPAALRAQWVLGDLAVIALEAPSASRVVTIVNPDDLDAPTALFTALLAGLRDNPYLDPMTTTRAFDTVPEDPATTVGPRELADGPTPPPPVGASTYRDHRTRLDAFARLARPGDPQVAVAESNLRSSVAVDRSSGSAGGTAFLRAVDATIDDYLAQIEVPDPGTITLTSRSGEIPLTFRNGTGTDVKVRATLTSDRLLFPGGSVLELDLPPRSTTVRVAVEAKTSGKFPLLLDVTTPDGVLAVSHRSVEVRSTFVSRVGIVLMAGAVVVLAGWWTFDLRRRRRRRRDAMPEVS